MLNSYINIFENKISELEERFKVMVQKEDIEVKNIKKVENIGDREMFQYLFNESFRRKKQKNK